MLGAGPPQRRQAAAHRSRAWSSATTSWSAGRRSWSRRSPRRAARSRSPARSGPPARTTRTWSSAAAPRSRSSRSAAPRRSCTRSPSSAADSGPPAPGVTTEQERGHRWGPLHSGAVRAGRAVRGRRAGQDGADRAAGARRDRGAVRQVQGDPARRAEHRRAVRRQGALHDRPARAGGLLPAAAGDHRGQPGGLDRHRHLLPGHRPGRRDVRDRQLHPGRRAADDDHAAQHRRWHGPRADADQPRRDQQPAARRARRGDRQVGHPRQPGRAQGHRPAAVDQGLDGEADARRPRQARRDPHRRGPAAVRDPHRRGWQAGRDPERRG